MKTKYHIILFSSLFYSLALSSQSSKIDSTSFLIKKLETSISAKENFVLENYQNLIKYSQKVQKYESITEYYDKVKPFLSNDSASVHIKVQIAKAYNILANYNASEELLIKAKKENKNIFLNAQICSDLSSNYRYKGDFKKSIEYAFEGINTSKRFKDSALLYINIESLGIGYYYLEEYNETITYFLKALNHYQNISDKDHLGFINNVLGLCYFKNNNNEKATFYLLESIKISKSINDERSLGDALNNLGLIYLKEGDYQKALDNFQKALELIIKMNDYRQKPYILTNIGEAQCNLGLIKEGINNFKDARNQASLSNNKNSTLLANKKLHYWYSTIEQFDSAYHYLNEYTLLNELMLSEKGELAVENIKFKLEKNQKEAEITALKNKNTISKFRYLTIGATLLLIIIVGLFIIYRQKTKLKLAKEKEARSEDKLKNAKKNLDDFFENLRGKNAIIDKLESEIKSYASSNKKENEATLNKIQELENLKILTDEDWNKFQNLFNQIYPNVLIKIKHAYPELTEGEKRMFVLIKLKLTNKEIANILGISPDSVNKSKYRLKKKLNLEEDQKLDLFVLEF